MKWKVGRRAGLLDQGLSGACLLVTLSTLSHLILSLSLRRKANVSFKHLHHYVAGVTAIGCGVFFLALHTGASFVPINRPEDCLWDWTSPYFWLLSRLFVQFFFVARIRQTFRGSAFALKKRMRHTIVALLLTLYIPFAVCTAAIMVYSMEYSMSDRRRDSMNGWRDCEEFGEKILMQPSVQLGAIVFLVLDCILASVQLRLYIRRLYGLVDGSTDFGDGKRHRSANSGSSVSARNSTIQRKTVSEPPCIALPKLKGAPKLKRTLASKSSPQQTGFRKGKTEPSTPTTPTTPTGSRMALGCDDFELPKGIPDVRPQMAISHALGISVTNGMKLDADGKIVELGEFGEFPFVCHTPQTTPESCDQSPRKGFPSDPRISITPRKGGAFQFPTGRNLAIPPRTSSRNSSPRHSSPPRHSHTRGRLSFSFSVSAPSLSALAANAEARRKRRKRYNPEMKRLAARTTVLALIAIMSSLAVPSLFYLFGTLVFAVDIAINSLCIYFCFSASQPMFKMCCTSCFKCSLALCIPCFFECCAWDCCECSKCECDL